MMFAICFLIHSHTYSSWSNCMGENNFSLRSFCFSFRSQVSGYWPLLRWDTSGKDNVHKNPERLSWGGYGRGDSLVTKNPPPVIFLEKNYPCRFFSSCILSSRVWGWAARFMACTCSRLNAVPVP